MTTTQAAPSHTTGTPLTELADYLGGPRIDDLLRAAATLSGERTALRSGATELTFRELDARADRCAAAVAALVEPSAVVAIAGALDPVFATAFFGTARAGRIAALVNPLLQDEGLAHVLNLSAARVAVVPPAVALRLLALGEKVPGLHHIVLTERGPGVDHLRTLNELMAGAPRAWAVPPAGPEDVACLQFTSGTTGAAKAVQLTHRNLTVNAAQVAHAHGLDADSVIFNFLPTWHLMHLIAGVTVGATHVLATQRDQADAIEEADRAGATHFYSIPVMLSRLAAHPRLRELAAPTLQVIMSGGTTMPPTTTTTLADHFGVPVVQGYGLAETSPLTHCDNADRPKLYSSGPVVAGTECRVVDVQTRAVLPRGGKGELEVRGPQVMHGYLGREPGADTDEDGWLRTGDIAYLDADGYLFVVDRIKDVFKCDNWLVAPTTIERVLMRHPGVTDCLVVDVPHEFSGAVAHGLVVTGDPELRPDDVIAFVAEYLPYYEHLHHVELVERIPRSANGKVQRRDVRDAVIAAQQA